MICLRNYANSFLEIHNYYFLVIVEIVLRAFIIIIRRRLGEKDHMVPQFENMKIEY